MLFEAEKVVIKLFNDFSLNLSEAKHASFHGKGLKILTPQKILQRLPIALAQAKVDDTYKNLLTEICQIIYSFYQAKEITKNLFNSIMISITL